MLLFHNPSTKLFQITITTPLSLLPQQSNFLAPIFSIRTFLISGKKGMQKKQLKKGRFCLVTLYDTVPHERESRGMRWVTRFHQLSSNRDK